MLLYHDIILFWSTIMSKLLKKYKIWLVVFINFDVLFNNFYNYE